MFVDTNCDSAGGNNKLIFVVEDDEDICRLVQYQLHSAGYDVRAFLSGSSVLAEGLRKQPALFVLDVMLPGINGFDLCRQIRQTDSLAKVPIIFVTAKASEADRIRGFELGGDDYLTKPFSPRELVARVRTVLRNQPETAQPAVLRFGEVEIDSSSMTVRVAGNSVFTTVREFRLLEYLAIHRMRVFSRDQLLDAVWKEAVTPRSVDVYIRRLREKIERDPCNPQYLKTFRGIGYRFEVPR
jgi:DNA-binding response OmpR family regulator